jgi:two-component sensor histidine kinase
MQRAEPLDHGADPAVRRALRPVRGLFWRITTLALLVPLALLAASGWWTWRNLMREAEARVERVTSTLEEQARRLIAVQETLLAGALARIEGLDWETVSQSASIQSFLAIQNRLANTSQAVSIMRLDTGRFVAWSEQQPLPDVDFSNRDYARAHGSDDVGTYIGEVVRAQPFGLLGFTISRRSPDGRAVAVSLIEVASLQAFQVSVRQDGDDVLALVRDDGMVLARTPPLPDPVGARLPPQALFSLYLKGETTSALTAASALDGVERIYRFRKVAPYPVHVAYGFETAAVRREFRERMLPSLVTTGLACIVLVLLSAYAARSVTGRKQADIAAEAARLAAESQRRAAALGEELRIALDGARLAPFERDLTTGEGRWTERIRELYGVGPELERNTIEDWMRLIHPDDRARVTADLRSAAQGEPHNTDYRIVMPDGAIRWIASRGNLQYDAEGRPTRAVGVCFDITSRKEAEAKLADERRRLRLGQELAGLGLGTVDYGTDRLTLDEMAGELFELPSQRWLPRSCLRDRMHPDDRTRVEAALDAALDPDGDGRLAVEARMILADGRTRWIAAQQQIEFATDEAGRRTPRSAVIVVRDVSDRRSREERIAFLMREVNHRSKNMLALVQAMARQTMAAGQANFFERFSERIQALAASHDLLVNNDWIGVEIGALARSQLAHFEDALKEHVTLEGPQLMLSAGAAQAIGMALHELATNAAKYGALSRPEGRVSLRWSIGEQAGRRQFTMTWTESGGPKVVEPSRRGFGSAVLGRLVEAQLEAEVELSFAPSGLVWHMRCALAGLMAGTGPEANLQTMMRPPTG